MILPKIINHLSWRNTLLKLRTGHDGLHIAAWFVDRERHERDLVRFELKIDRYFVTPPVFQNHMNVLHPISDLTVL